MDNDLLKKIDERLGRMESEQKRQGDEFTKRLNNLEAGQARATSILEAVQAGQENQATKADIHDLKVELTRKINDHERRIENLEEETDTPNPYKH